jgi:hypothetical protein
MTLPEHLHQAMDKLEAASERIELAKGQSVSLETLRDWLSALTDFTLALAEVHEFDREEIDKFMHEMAGRVGLERLSSSRKRFKGAGSS